MKTLLVLSLIALCCFPLSCGSPAAAMQAAAPDCVPEPFFDGPSGNNNGIEGQYSLWFATDACVITVQVDQGYTTTHDHLVQRFTMQMGSNQGSVFEWDQVLHVTRPDGVDVMPQQQQYDKHADDKGNRQETYLNSTPIFIPAGSRVRIVRRAQPANHCIVAGDWGNGKACATGASVQFQDVVR